MAKNEWHREPTIIALLLVFLPPLGILLMWIHFRWSSKTKLVVSLASAAWFGFALVIGTAARDEREAAKAQARVALTSSATRPPATGAVIVEQNALLAVPTDLDGFSLASATANSPCCGYVATYASSSPKTARIELKILVQTSKDSGFDGIKGARAIAIGGHKAIIDDDAKLNDVNVQWVAGNWNGWLIAHVQAGDRSGGHDVAQQAAAKASALLDRYLSNTPPSERDRDDHLSSIANLLAAGDAKARADRVTRFVAHLRQSGIDPGTVVDAAADRLGGGDDVIVTVGSEWLDAPKSSRLDAAQTLWQVWTRIVNAPNPDTVHIAFVDAKGNRVGGSGTAGSAITVAD